MGYNVAGDQALTSPVRSRP